MPMRLTRTLARSCAPCTTKRPASTGVSPSRLALTQSLAASVSKASAFAASAPGRERDQRAHRGLVRRIEEMDRDRPAAAGFVGGDHGLRRVEDLRQPVEQIAGGVRRAGLKPGHDRRAGSRISGVGGRDRHVLSTSFTGSSSHDRAAPATALSTAGSSLFPNLSTALTTALSHGAPSRAYSRPCAVLGSCPARYAPYRAGQGLKNRRPMGAKPCVRPDGGPRGAACARRRPARRPLLGLSQPAAGGLSRPAGHHHRAVRAGRPDRHHRAHPGQRAVATARAASSSSTTAPAPPATPAWGRSRARRPTATRCWSPRPRSPSIRRCSRSCPTIRSRISRRSRSW